jgi:hypothetical protein
MNNVLQNSEEFVKTRIARRTTLPMARRRQAVADRLHRSLALGGRVMAAFAAILLVGYDYVI